MTDARPCPRCGDLVDGQRCPACGAHMELPKPRGRHVAVKQHDLSPSERAEYGVIATCECGGARETLHRPGTAKQALQAICDEIDGWPGEWRILSISTPVTVMRDLEGTRANIDQPSQHWNRPEASLLGRLGRMDLLHPSLRL